jgi:hypothetical protein
MKLLGLTDNGVRHSTDAAHTGGTAPAAKTTPAPAGTTPAPGKTGGTDSGSTAGSNGVTSVEALNKRLDDLARENDVLRGQVTALTTENVGKKKRLQGLEVEIGDLTPTEVRERLKEAEDLKQAEHLRKGEFEKAQEVLRTAATKERDGRIAAEKREMDRVLERDILSGAAANNPLPQAMQRGSGTHIPILAVTRDAFEYDATTGDVLHRTETVKDGDRLGKKMTPTEFFAQERTKSLAIYFASGVLPGGGASAKGAEGAGGDVVEIAYDDPKKVDKADAANKAGKQFRIVRQSRV